MPILNRDVIQTKIQTHFDTLSNSVNSLSLLVDVETAIQLNGNSNNFISTVTSRTIPEYSSSNNQIIYLSDIDTYAIYSQNGWYDLNGKFYPTTPIGDICSWGDNANGKLGDGTIVDKSSPVPILGQFIDWCQVSAGYAHTAAIRTNGTLWSWGNAACGALGDNTTVNKSSPVSVVGVFTDWTNLSIGGRSTTALRSNGTLWSWGYNRCGQLGDGTTVNKCSPISVIGGFTDWCQVSVGGDFTAAIRTNGTLWTWGAGNCGKLGHMATTPRCSPGTVCGGFTDWCQVAAGSTHTIALRTNGTLWAWGCNSIGQLGVGNTVDNWTSPVSVRGGITDWCQVSSGFAFSAAVRINGTLWSWGCNRCGKLGDGTIDNRSSPVSIVGGFTDWCQVAAGSEHTLAIRTNGTLWSWGCNSNGTLGDGTTVDKSSPVSVAGLENSWFQISAADTSLGVLRHTINI